MIVLRNGAARRLCGLGVGLFLLGGCNLLDTDTPDIIEPGGLESPEGAEALRFGAIRDFGFVKDGDGSQEDTEGLVLLTGSMADEFNYSGFIPSDVEFDQRQVVTNNSSLTSLYFRLHVARAGAERAAAALQEFSLDPDNDPGIPEMLSLAGYTYLFFGENFCSGVPYSTVEGDELVYGPAQTTEQTLLRAVERFDAALAHGGAAADPDMANLAAVGKGRALLNLGRFVEAAQAVQAVPTEFQYLSEHDASPLSLSNAIFVYGVTGEGEDAAGSISVADAEGENGIPYRTAEDPRVPFLDTGHFGLDQTTPQFDVLKYPEEGSSIVVADGVEARLIEAENQLRAGNFAGMNTILNDLRGGFELDPLDEPGTTEDAVDQLFSERAFWLYATAHRLGDMRRLVRQYERPVEEVFPVGEYLRGGSYGDAVNIPVPISENNNPEFDRAQCDQTVP